MFDIFPLWHNSFLSVRESPLSRLPSSTSAANATKVSYSSAFIHAEHPPSTPPPPRPNVEYNITRSTAAAHQRFWYILSINTHKGIPTPPHTHTPSSPHIVLLLLALHIWSQFCQVILLMLYYMPSFYFCERWLCPHVAPSFNLFVSGLRAGVHSAVGLFHLKSYAPCTLAREYVS